MWYGLRNDQINPCPCFPHSNFISLYEVKSIQNWVNVYIFLPLPKVTLSRQKNKQSHGTVQSYQIEHEIYLIFMLQNVEKVINVFTKLYLIISCPLSNYALSRYEK